MTAEALLRHDDQVHTAGDSLKRPPYIMQACFRGNVALPFPVSMRQRFNLLSVLVLVSLFLSARTTKL